MTATATQLTCACESCACKVEVETAIQKDGQYYCCQACANGHPHEEACGSADCNCGG